MANYAQGIPPRGGLRKETERITQCLCDCKNANLLQNSHKLLANARQSCNPLTAKVQK